MQANRTDGPKAIPETRVRPLLRLSSLFPGRWHNAEMAHSDLPPKGHEGIQVGPEDFPFPNVIRPEFKK
jgi:hypothetical protein